MTMTRTEIKAQFGSLLEQAAMSNPHAVEFLLDAFCVAHTWDDLIDRDRPISDEDINEAFYTALVKLPRNPFYRQHTDRLGECLERHVLDWLTTTRWERDPEMTRQQAEIAWIIRGSYTQLVTETALILGGFGRALAVQDQVRQIFHHEGIDGYLQALAMERKVQHG